MGVSSSGKGSIIKGLALTDLIRYFNDWSEAGQSCQRENSRTPNRRDPQKVRTESSLGTDKIYKSDLFKSRNSFLILFLFKLVCLLFFHCKCNENKEILSSLRKKNKIPYVPVNFLSHKVGTYNAGSEFLIMLKQKLWR